MNLAVLVLHVKAPPGDFADIGPVAAPTIRASVAGNGKFAQPPSAFRLAAPEDAGIRRSVPSLRARSIIVSVVYRRWRIVFLCAGSANHEQFNRPTSKEESEGAPITSP
jgi:hypothetical protein